MGDVGFNKAVFIHSFFILLRPSISLYRRGRHLWFGGATMVPPLEAPHEGSALEATIEGGGLVIAIVILRPQMCCLAALSRRRDLRQRKLLVQGVTEGNG